MDSLSSNKAPGEDNINGELLKHGTPLLDKPIADIYNTAFEKHEDLDIKGGVLIAIQKTRQKEGSTRQPAPNQAAKLAPESVIYSHPEPDKTEG